MEDREFEATIAAQPEDGQRYAFVCEEIKSGLSKAGMPKFELKMRLVANEDGTASACAGWEATVHVSRSPAASFQVAAMLSAFGIPSAERVKFRASQIEGHIVTGLVEYQEYNGRTSPRVQELSRYGGPALTVQSAPKDDIPF